LAAVDNFVPVEFAQEEWLRAGVAKGNEELLKLVEAGFEAISESERNEIKNRWFVEPADDSYNWVLFPVLIVFLLGGMAFWFFGNPFRSS